MPFNKEMQRALEADGEKLRQLTGEDHGPWPRKASMSTWDDEPNDYVHAMAEIWRLRAALEPFSQMAGELFARNKNEDEILIALDNPDDPHRITVADFFEARRVLAGKR